MYTRKLERISLLNENKENHFSQGGISAVEQGISAVGTGNADRAYPKGGADMAGRIRQSSSNCHHSANIDIYKLFRR